MYTNSIEQLQEIRNLVRLYTGKDIEKSESVDAQYKILKKFIFEHESDLVNNKELLGNLSYLCNPLFYSNYKLNSIIDYDEIFQGHTHFELEDKILNTNIHSIESLLAEGKNSNKASYIILSRVKGETNDVKINNINVEFDREKMEHTISTKNFPKTKIKKFTGMN